MMKLEYQGIDLSSADVWSTWSQRFSLIFLCMRELRESHKAVKRVPSRFSGIQDLAYFKAGIRDFEGKGGRDSGL